MPSLGLGDRESWKMFNWGRGSVLALALGV